MVTETEQVVDRFLAAWKQASVDELLDFFTDDAVWRPMPMAPVTGKGALREALAGWLEGAVALDVEVKQQLSNATTVMHERTDRFSLGGEEHETPVCAVFEIDDGRIAAWREYFDMSPYAQD